MVRGEVLRLRAPRTARGHEQRGVRHAVVIQADELLGLNTVLAAPTSRSAIPASFRPKIDLGGTETLVLLDQTTATDLSRFGGSEGRLEPAEMLAIDDALRMLLGLF